MPTLFSDQFPRSNKYDPCWVFENEMGPNVLWLTEFLCEKMNLRPGMRVLDMGCGKALSSIFLVKEFDVDVVANDLWIDPTENWKRIKEAGLADRIIPIRAEANALPYAAGYFDAAVCVDCYPYFGSKPGYTAYFTQFIQPGGRFGVSHLVFSRRYTKTELESAPEYLRRWQGGIDAEIQASAENGVEPTFTLAEWTNVFRQSGTLNVLTADVMGNGCAVHTRFLEEHKQAGFTYRAPRELDDWKLDGGANFDFLRIVGEVVG